MKITIDHPASSYGVPVMLDDDGSVLPYAKGIRMIRKRLRLSTSDLGAMCGVSARTIEQWEYKRLPHAAALNVMSTMPINTFVPRPTKIPKKRKPSSD